MKHRFNFRGVVASLLATALLTLGNTPALTAQSAQSANPPASHAFPQSRPIVGRYIVVFKDNVDNPAAQAANAVRGLGGQVHHVYSSAIKGFAATLPPAALQGILNNPNVDYVEQDQTIQLNQTSPETSATWGIDRVDQADRPLDSLYHFAYNGAGVNAFIIDTGIRLDHVEFTGRLLSGYSAVADGNGTNDCNGHGTHVSGTVGGTTWGVAKGVSLIPVRVLDCTGSGTSSGVVAGIDWGAASSLRPAVANLSLGGSTSSSLNSAVASAVSKGVTMVVAAGNSNADACNYSPSGERSAITVGATTFDDIRASYSNYGSCVDIFAPGSNITSAWNTSSTSTNTISGTSMATPHVTGVAALALAANPIASPSAVAAFLTANATANRLSSIGVGSPNLLLFSLAAGKPVDIATPSVAIASLTGTSAISGKNWIAYATATVRNIDTSALVAGATVNGSFSPGGTSNCVTGTNGACTLASANISRNTSTVVMSITNVTGTNMTYKSSQNSATQITIAKP